MFLFERQQLLTILNSHSGSATRQHLHRCVHTTVNILYQLLTVGGSQWIHIVNMHLSINQRYIHCESKKQDT